LRGVISDLRSCFIMMLNSSNDTSPSPFSSTYLRIWFHTPSSIS
jgi:hypothetical protein